MQNMGAEEFDYNSFKLAYDGDEVIQALTHRFDQNGIELMSKAQKDDKTRAVEKEKDSNVVSQMAKRATNKHLG